MHSPSDDRTPGGYVPDPRLLAGTAGPRRRQAVRTADLHTSESALSRTYLPLRLRPIDRRPALNTTLDAIDVGAVTVGTVQLGAEMRITTDAAANYHLDIPVRGHSRSKIGTSRELVTSPGAGQVFLPGAPADLLWSPDARVICVMLGKAETERRLAAVLGRELDRPLVFEPVLELGTAAGGVWKHVLPLVDYEMRRDAGMLAFSLTRHTVEGLLIEALLTGHAHNYSAELRRRQQARGPADRIRSAVELLEEQPERAWTTTELASAIGIGARTLQEGFRARLGTSPMTYLRDVRLDQVREELAMGDLTTEVSEVARRWGFAHLGRFAAEYRRRHGELPSHTLREARRQ